MLTTRDGRTAAAFVAIWTLGAALAASCALQALQLCLRAERLDAYCRGLVEGSLNPITEETSFHE